MSSSRLGTTPRSRDACVLSTGVVEIKEGSTSVCAFGLTGGKGACTLSPKELAPSTYKLAAAYRSCRSSPPPRPPSARGAGRR